MGKQLKSKNQQGLAGVVSLLVIFFALFLVFPSNKEDPSQQTTAVKGAESFEDLSSGLRVGDPVPSVSLLGERGRISLSDYKGQPLLIEFLSTDCPYCKELAPRLKKARQSYPDVKTLLIGVGKDSLDDIKRWRSRYGPGAEALLDNRTEGVSKFAVVGTPTLVWINKEGIVSSYHTGSPTDATLKKYFEKAVTE